MPEEDATGACDGVINGQFGFHTQLEDDPWWEVDLGQITGLDTIRIYNRTDFARRASRIKVLVARNAGQFEQVYQHDGTTFYGLTDKKPLTIPLQGRQGRYVRLQLPGREYFHLDEVEICPIGNDASIALEKPSNQSSVSQWSKRSKLADLNTAFSLLLDRGCRLADSLARLGAGVEQELSGLKSIRKQFLALPREADDQTRRSLYFRARWLTRHMAFSNPLLDFDTILFVKRAPGTLPHISDQYYGWWSRPGGGICLLKDFKSEQPQVLCLTSDWPQGSFLRPDLSYNGGKVLFAYCKYHPQVAGMEKVDKEKLPEDAFYHIYEMNIDGTGIRQLTHGRYDDFDARYLPNNEIIFLSTRKGQFIQCSEANTRATLKATFPDSYVRCGGDNKRPCAVYTLHAMDANGRNLRPISAFETFEYTPSVADDGRILYTRWDYIDRFNGHFFSLWSTNQDGTNPQLVYGNFTQRPQAVLEARSIPNSHR
ncbi:MAG: discoidin domain-containing protein, partial [Phycisphaerales bacterium]